MRATILQSLAVGLLLLCISTGAFAGGSLNPTDYLDRPRVLAFIRRFTAEDMKDWIVSTIDRGSFFHEHIMGRIQEYELPSALAFLPAIESGYDPRAMSPSGAAGLWQFMMNSIGGYDMLVDDWVDERNDFWKATSASLRKLAYNQEQLGDWLLAIGAYNCGLNRMKQAIKESGSSDFWTLAEGGYLPRETASYVPKFLAIAYIAGHTEDYGLQLRSSNRWRWRRVLVTRQINIRLLAEASSVPEDILLLGNAELRYDVTPPPDQPSGLRYHLKVPDIYTDVIERVLRGDALALNRYHVHTITSGDTLYALSRDFGVSVDLIMHHNPGIKPRYLQIDSAILIPAIRDVPRPGAQNTGNRW